VLFATDSTIEWQPTQIKVASSTLGMGHGETKARIMLMDNYHLFQCTLIMKAGGA
jgi:hypothetical protein